MNGKRGDLFHGLSGIVEITNNVTGQKINLTENTTATSLPDGTLEIKKTVNKELIELEVLEQDVGEPVDDMPDSNLEDDSGSTLPEDPNESTSNVNQIIIKLKNSSSEEKNLIIKYTN